MIKVLLVRLWKSGVREVSLRQAEYNVYKRGTPAYAADAVLLADWWDHSCILH